MCRAFFCFLSLSLVSLSQAVVDFGNVLWEYEAGASVTSSPALDSSGNLFFGSLDGNLYSLDGDGRIRWSYDVGDWVDSSPALSLDESTVYVGSWNNRLTALDATTGAMLWFFETDNLVYASPAIALDGTIYFGSSDGLLYALNPDGSLKWEFEIGGELDSSPALDANGNIYVGSSIGLVSCISPLGLELWSWEVPTETSSTGRDFGVSSSPMLTAEGHVIVGSENFFVYALNTADGELRWKYETDGVIEGSAVEGMGRSCLIGGRDGYLYSFSWDGELNWRTQVGANYYSTPCVDGMGRIYAGVLKSSSQGRLVVISSAGEILWQIDFENFVDSSPLLAPDGTLYVGNNDGRLYAIEGGDKLASLGWSSFRGGVNQHRSLEGYVDLSGSRSDLFVSSSVIDGTDQFLANYVVEGGGPVQVEIRAVGAGFQESEGVSEYALSLWGSSGEMAFVEAFEPLVGAFDGRMRGWLEPGVYTIEALNESAGRDAFFLEVKVQ